MDISTRKMTTDLTKKTFTVEKTEMNDDWSEGRRKELLCLLGERRLENSFWR